MTIPQPPEVPYPFPPEWPDPRRERQPTPIPVPMVDEPSGSDVVGRMLDRRRVLLTGPLDAAAANRLAAELMTLDGESGTEVEVLVNSPGGPLPAVIPVLDVLSLMRARVDTTCFGRAHGTACAVLAAGTGTRAVSTHAAVTLRCEFRADNRGTPDDLRRALEELTTARAHLLDVLSERTGQPKERLQDQIDEGPSLTPEAAIDLGLVDRIATRAGDR